MKPSRPFTAKEAMEYCGALCARSEQCTPDLIDKMRRRGLPQHDIHSVVERLQALGWVDDCRFARAYAHDKMAYSGWGQYKITQGLRTKRIDRSAIDQCMDGIDAGEYRAVAERVVRAKARQLPDGVATYESRSKLMRHGLQRGFDTHLVSGIISRLVQEARSRGDEGLDGGELPEYLDAEP